MSDIKARLAEMYPAGQPNEYTLTLPKQALAPTSTVADDTAADTDDDAQDSTTDETDVDTDDETPEGVADPADTGEDQDQQAANQRDYFVRGIHDDRLTDTQFNIRESMRWLTDQFSQPAQFQPDDVPPGHYTSSDVSDEEVAEAYLRHTGTPYRRRNYTIKSNRPL